MLANRVFQITLLVSLITHGVILFQNAGFNTSRVDQKLEETELSYIKTKKLPKKIIEKKPAKKAPLLKLTTKTTLEKKVPPPFLGKKREINFAKPILKKPDIISVKKKIKLFNSGGEKINNTNYMNHYQFVYEKIRRYLFMNYSGTETGEVNLTFVITKDGYLEDYRIIDTESSPNTYLREVVVRSLKNAEPFPVFPKELDFPRLSFNVIVSFEIE